MFRQFFGAAVMTMREAYQSDKTRLTAKPAIDKGSLDCITLGCFNYWEVKHERQRGNS